MHILAILAQHSVDIANIVMLHTNNAVCFSWAFVVCWSSSVVVSEDLHVDNKVAFNNKVVFSISYTADNGSG